jgi:hypothetical protein
VGGPGGKVIESRRGGAGVWGQVQEGHRGGAGAKYKRAIGVGRGPSTRGP